MSVPLRFDSRLLEPPTPALPPTRYVRAASSSEVSSLGDLHDDSVSIMPDTPQQRYQHNQYSICQHGQEQQQQYYQQQTQTHRRSTLNSLRFDSTPMGHDNDDDDGFDYENEHVVVRGAIPNSDLRNVSALSISIGAAVGMLLAIVLAQVDGARDAALVKYVLLLPGELYGNGMLCAVLPTVFLNAVLGSMHFSTLNKTKALGSKMLVYFAATTLWASLLGALLALCFVPTFTENNALHLAATVSSNSNTTSPLLAFRCPAGSSNQSLVLQSDGVMRCAPSLERVNSTLFRVEDLAHSFRIPSGDAALRTSGSARAIAMAAAIPTVSDQAMQLLESCFPLNVLDAFARSDVLSVVLAGGALGMALLHFASLSSVAGTSDSSLLLLLVTQSEVILSVLLRALLQALPFAMASLVCGALLRSPRESDVQPLAPSMQDLASLTGVLLFALVLDLATVLGLASVVTKSNPLPFVRQLIPAQLVALGTSSSLLALPTTVRSIAATKQVSMPLAHVVCATGAALNKNGTAVYLSVASVYIVTAAGLQGDALTASHILALVFASVLGACVLPPLPRGSAIVAGAILTSVFDISAGEPGVRVLLAFLLAMDWLCDPLVTALNVTHNAVVALVLAHAMDERFRDPSFASTQEADEIIEHFLTQQSTLLTRKLDVLSAIESCRASAQLHAPVFESATTNTHGVATAARVVRHCAQEQLAHRYRAHQALALPHLALVSTAAQQLEALVATAQELRRATSEPNDDDDSSARIQRTLFRTGDTPNASLSRSDPRSGLRSHRRFSTSASLSATPARADVRVQQSLAAGHRWSDLAKRAELWRALSATVASTCVLSVRELAAAAPVPLTLE